MQIRINGKEEAVSATTLAELINELGLPGNSLVVEHNQKIVKQANWATTTIREQDVIELLSFVGGG